MDTQLKSTATRLQNYKAVSRKIWRDVVLETVPLYMALPLEVPELHSEPTFLMKKTHLSN